MNHYFMVATLPLLALGGVGMWYVRCCRIQELALQTQVNQVVRALSAPLSNADEPFADDPSQLPSFSPNELSDCLQPQRKLRRRSPETPPDDSEIFSDVASALRQVPPLPRVVYLLLAELQSDRATAASVAEIIRTDPVMAGAVLHVVNAPAYGLVRKILSVEESVAYLGFDAVKNLMLRLQLGRLIAPGEDRCCGYDAETLWDHSLAVGQIAAHLARQTPGTDVSFASTLGLMHDIGKLAINSYFPRKVELLLSGRDVSPGESFLGRERRAFGADHAAIGGFLAARWELPELLVTAIRIHHNLEEAYVLPPELRRAVEVVHVANQLAKLAQVYCEDMEIDLVKPEMLQSLGLAEDLELLLTPEVLKIMDHAAAIKQQPAGALQR